MDTIAAADSLSGLSQLLTNGGPVVAILLVMSVVAVALVLLKLQQMASLRIFGTGFIQEALSLWREQRGGEAVALLQRQRNPIAGVLGVAIAGLRAGKDEALVREEAARIGAAHLENLRGQLRGLEVIATLSPLLGLLGTVMGMITAFQQLEAAGSQVDPAVLSGGIWEALLTTAVGLAVAIPASAAQSFLERLVERFRHRMEDALTQVFTHRPGVGAREPEDEEVATFPERRAADAY